MTEIEKELQRFDAFDANERDVLHFALTSTAQRIMDNALEGRIPAEVCASGAETFRILSSLALELVDNRDADLAALETVIEMIASGAAQVVPSPAKQPLGAHADVPVSAEEDEELGR